MKGFKKLNTSEIRGIYALARKGEIVYIGGANDILRTIRSKTRKIEHDECFYKEIPEDVDLNVETAKLILKSQPQDNKVIPAQEKYMTYTKLKNRLLEIEDTNRTRKHFRKDKLRKYVNQLEIPQYQMGGKVYVEVEDINQLFQVFMLTE